MKHTISVKSIHRKEKYPMMRITILHYYSPRQLLLHIAKLSPHYKMDVISQHAFLFLSLPPSHTYNPTVLWHNVRSLHFDQYLLTNMAWVAPYNPLCIIQDAFYIGVKPYQPTIFHHNQDQVPEFNETIKHLEISN